MEFYFKNWVQLSYYFGKVVPSVTTQGKVILALAYPQTAIYMYEVLPTCLNDTIATPYQAFW
jgi:hypothetical protein